MTQGFCRSDREVSGRALIEERTPWGVTEFWFADLDVCSFDDATEIFVDRDHGVYEAFVPVSETRT